MKRALLTLALLSALPSAAGAATYWVAPDSASGLGIGSPYRSGNDTSSVFPGGPKTLAWFNANADSGDVCRFKSGDYGSTPIAMPRSGTAANRIRYYGFPEDPTAVRVYNIQIGRQGDPSFGDYVTVKWITTTNAFSGMLGMFNYGLFPVGDSIVNCRSAAAASFGMGGSNHVVDSLELSGTNNGGGTFLWVGGGHDCKPNPPTETCYPCATVTHYYPGENNRITNCTFNWTRTAGYAPSNGLQAIKYDTANNTVFAGNTINFSATNLPNGGYLFAFEGYNSDFNTFQNNTWNITNNVTSGTRGIWCFRDWSVGNRFMANTVNVTGTGSIAFIPTNSGSCDFSVDGNYYGFNTININGVTAGSGVFHWQNGLRADTLEFNTIATSATNPLVGIYPGMSSDRGIIRHNTFFTAGATAIDLAGGTGNYSEGTRLAANVYYVQTANSSGAEIVKVPVGTDMDSSGVFFSPTGDPAFAIAYGGHAGVPGSGGNYGGVESKWGTPLLSDSSYSVSDGRVKQGGYAVSTDYHDGYVGIGVQDADVTAPAVSVTFPADTMYAWTGGEVMPVTWTASDAVGITSIVLEYGSTQTPATEPVRWSTIATLAGNVTSYDWTMGGVARRYGMVRVRAFDAAGNVGSSTALYLANISAVGDPSTQEDVP